MGDISISDAYEYTLRFTETAKVRTGTFRASISVVFAGRINDATYSLAILWPLGNNSMAYNLYLDKKNTKIFIPKVLLEILYVSDKEIRFR